VAIHHQNRVQVDRLRNEDGYSLDSWDERGEAELDSEIVFRGFRKVIGSTIDDSLPVIDTADIPATARTDDRRSEIRIDGGNSRSVEPRTDRPGGG